MFRPILFSILAMSLAVSIGGQSPVDLDTKYPVVKAYEVRPGVLMTPRYAGDGQVCEMVLEMRRVTQAGISLAANLTEEEVLKLVEQLVPEDERGKKRMNPSTGKAYNSSFADGDLITVEYSYDSISVEFVRVGILKGSMLMDRCPSDMVAIIKWKKRTCAGASAWVPRPSK